MKQFDKSCTDADVKMPSPLDQLDRRRLKDRVLESVARAVKHLQEFQSRAREDALLVNEDWQLQRLVEHLDHAFLHGLRHITNGYWVVVQEFTHKSTVKDITRLVNVTTNLGRSRAWLYQALNDHLLECYTRCFLDNPNMVKKFYVKEALVLDQQRMQVLLTLTSGLELISFQLDVDMPYLDLASHMKQREPREEEEDRDETLSLCSMNSSMSQGSSANLDDLLQEKLVRRSTEAIIPPLTGDREDSTWNTKGGLKPSSSLPIIGSFGWVRKPLEALRGRTSLDGAHNTVAPSAGPTRNTCDITVEEDGDDVEVIHCKPSSHKTRRRRTRERKKKDGDLASITSRDCDVTSVNSASEAMTPESGIGSVVGNSSPKISDWEKLLSESDIQSRDPDQKSAQQDGECGVEGDSMVDSGLHNSSYCEESSEVDLAGQVGTEPVPACCPTSAGPGVENLVSPSQNKQTQDVGGTSFKLEMNRVIDVNWTPPMICHALPEVRVEEEVEIESDGSIEIRRSQDESSHEKFDASKDDVCDAQDGDKIGENVHNKCEISSGERSAPPDATDSCEELSIYDSVPSSCGERQEETISCDTPAQEVPKDNIDCDTPVCAKSNCELPSATKEEPKASASDNEDCVGAKSKRGKPNSATTTNNNKGENVQSHDAEIKVDNNLMLLLMLEVFEEEHQEKFVKMFQSCLGHTDGEIKPVFVLITDRALYLLVTRYGAKKFHKEGVVKYSELDYISLSINYQVINIVCTNRRKQFWITTGDEQLTKCIVSHLDSTIRHSEVALSRLSVLTDATTQKIAIRKWLAGERAMQGSDVTILSYTLVYWEDLQDAAVGTPVISGEKEGTLLYRSHDSLFGFGPTVWLQGYFVLKGNSLLQYASKHDAGGPLQTIQLNKEECVGCRRCRQGERSHSFELILADGSSLLLSAASDADVQDWLQSLCQAISYGMGLQSPRQGCLPCCCVLSPSHVVLCHEDLQTNFLRTLGSAAVTDVTSFLVDPGAQTYMVLVLDRDASKSSFEKWVLYFNTRVEREKFITAFNQAWKAYFGVTLPQGLIEDISLQRLCREGIGKLKQQRRL